MNAVNYNIVCMTNWTPNTLDPDLPRYAALARAIADDVRAGFLRPGDKLPTHRDLADALGVNVSTVTRGYKEAMHQGLICGTVGRGTFIAADAGADRALVSTESMHGPNLLELGLVTPLYGLDPDVRESMERLAKNRDLSGYLRYSTPGGLPEHKEAGAVWAGKHEMPAPQDRVVVFSGVQHGLTCCMLSLFRPGEHIAVEQLTYPGIKSLSSMAGVQLAPVEMDEQGMIPEALDTACRRDEIQGVYLMPGVQNPTAAFMSMERRQAIAQVIEKRGLTLLEDDAYAMTREEKTPPVSSFIPNNAIFFAGISKAFWPGLRVCFCVVPARIQRILAEAVLNTVWMTPPLNVALAAEMILSGKADKVLAAKREEAARRNIRARDILKGFSYTGYDTGFFLWLNLPRPWTGRTYEDAARNAGVRVFGAEKFAVGGTPAPAAARISLTGPESLEALSKGLSVLRDILDAPGPPPEGIL